MSKINDRSGLSLQIRLVRPEDGAYFAALLGQDRETVRCMASLPWPMTESTATHWLKERLADGACIYAVLRRDDRTFLGTAGYGLRSGREGTVAEVGFWVGRPYRGQGVASRGLALALRRAAQDGAVLAVGNVFPDNAASARVLRNNGFVFVGQHDEELPLRGGLRRLDVYQRSLGDDG
ncbi:Protein N-acetyltransferase, RimJ/RimL family [Paucidesulfovibrio gracilis DSM 16080]|uniref:Protein N-acetyltransferase, RimJ/RimL family n=1 Tax=Paucidesulfovibrio gracilis DSM 16080 TaxID=1121449 RepID=A0A1T4WDB4_9BACT|nr:GNAT family N-acetyltransferase [Paucidesulfovibrio gracilis]SKA75008.1 Protein N-acetyltransferase, RimJ/RimL family [Paucidesulfovibrio gracilis DSM 16080]